MKKTFYRLPYPLLLLSFGVIGIAFFLLIVNKISISAFILCGIIPLLLISSRRVYKIGYNAKKITIYHQLLFYKYDFRDLEPRMISIITSKVVRKKVRGKRAQRTSATDRSYKLVLLNKKDKTIFEENGYENRIESLAEFISKNMHLEIKRKTVTLPGIPRK